MNLVFKVTLESMKRNKRRTLITILGVIISVTMVSGVSTISSSMLDLIRRSSIASGGEWHVQYNDIPAENMQVLKDDEIESTVISNAIGYAALEHVKNPRRPYMFINAYEDGCMDKLTISMIEGRYPQNDQEIMIPSSLLEIGNQYAIGEEITLGVGVRFIDDYEDEIDYRFIDQNYSYQKDKEALLHVNPKKYIVTGIFDDQSFNQYQAGYEAITSLKKGDYQPGYLFDAKIVMKNVSNSIYPFSDQKLEELGCSSLYYNTTLLITYGVNSDDKLLQTINLVIFIVGCLILIGSVSLIYNAFAISLAERSRYLGMLSSVGATKRQKRNSVFYEAFVIGCIAIPIGFLFGYAGMWITFRCIDGFLMNTILEGIYRDVHLRLIIDWKSFLAAFLFSALIIFISAWRPAVRASKISPIDAIRQSNEVQIKPRHLKTWKGTRALFGFEAELALKNMKRNKSRYNATLFSLIMSIVLFLSVSFFQQLISKSFTMYSGEQSSAITTSIEGYDGTSEAQDYIKELVSVEGIQSKKETFIYRYNAEIPSEVINEDVLKYSEDNRFMINLIAYDDVTFEAYCKESGIDVTAFQNDTLQGILVNKRTFKNGHEYTEIQMFNENIKDQFLIEYFNQGAKELIEIPISLTAISTLAEPIISDQNKESLYNVSIIISKQAMDHFLQERIAEHSHLYMKTTLYLHGDASTIETNLLKVSENQNLYQTSILNQENAYKQQEQLLIFVSIFLYGFVSLMLLISMTNIFNTISTGMLLRKQEFAMLKSVGITPKGFRKLLIYENMFYAIKSLLYGIPISIAFSYLLYLALNRNFDFAFFLPFNAIFIAIVGIFTLVLLTMLYSIHKVKNDNIVETIRNESI